MDCTMQRGGAALAVLFKAQVNGRERAVQISDAVDYKPALQGIAAASVAGPIKTAQHRIVKRVALQARVVPRLELSERVHGLEIAGPLFIPIDPYRQVTRVGSYRESRGRLCVRVGLTLADEVADVTLQVDIVAACRC